MRVNRKPLPRKASSAQDQQFENLLRRAANYQKAKRRRSSTPKVRAKAQKRTRAA